MTEIIIGSCVGAAVIALDRLWAIARRRWMRRHPAPTFVFADLAGYTALTEKHGDEAAAEVARKFRRTMRGLSRRHGAWEVKTMGDGIMIWVSNAAQAIALAAGAVEQVQASVDLPPVRVGVHTGPAVMQGSDWFGSAVNVAARLADEAAPGEALISAATRSAACGAMTGPLLTGPLMTGREIVLRGLERPIVAWRLG